MAAAGRPLQVGVKAFPTHLGHPRWQGPTWPGASCRRGRHFVRRLLPSPRRGNFGERSLFSVLFCQRMRTPTPGAWCGTPLLPIPPGKKAPFPHCPAFWLWGLTSGKAPGVQPCWGGQMAPGDPPPSRPPHHLPRSIPPAGVTPKALGIPAGPEPSRVAGEGRGPGGCRGGRLRGGSRLRGRWWRGAAAAGPGGDAEHSWRAGYIWSGFQRAGPGPAPPPLARESAPRLRRHRGPLPVPGADEGGTLPVTGDPLHPFSAPTDVTDTGEGPSGSSTR